SPWIFEDTQSIHIERQRLSQVLDQFQATQIKASMAEILLADCTAPSQLPYHGLNDRLLKEQYGRFMHQVLSQLDVPLSWDPVVTSKNQSPQVGFVVTGGHENAFYDLMFPMVQRFQKITPFLITSAAGNQRIRAKAPEADIEFLVLPSGLEEMVQTIRDRQLDALFFFEVGTDVVNSVLPFYRLAPVQCTSWGYPVTTGIPNMDYFLSSILLEPEEGESYYTESLVTLDTLPAFFQKPQLPSGKKTRQDFGIDTSVHLYGCPHQALKLHPDFDDWVADILRQDPEGQLVLIEMAVAPRHQAVQARMEKNIPDVIDRIHFLPRMSHADFTDLLVTINVLLDPIYFGGGITTYEALAVGTPIVTMPGEFMRGRVTYGCYKKMDMLDCVVNSKNAYVDLAVKLGTDPTALQAVKEKILASNDVIYEDQTAVEALESFFIQAKPLQK
ncbi:MAG: hypothetical protein KTR14_06240, partial [Vampirovibrio sp.]|nr:hypothetical protein [Vampirovibrio sp.]